jgi:hypothetical protein
MVNKIVLEYLRVNKGNYNLEDLKKKVLASGYSQMDVDAALVELNKETQGAIPSVSKTINKINQTNLSEKNPVKSKTLKKQKVKKKSKKWLWIILGSILLILGLGGAALWYFWDILFSSVA